jgi:hypothetical protein
MKKLKDGDVVTDEFGEPVEAQYSTFKIEYTNILSSNVQDLTKDLIEVTNDTPIYRSSRSSS